jgi:hypothetical protein
MSVENCLASGNTCKKAESFKETERTCQANAEVTQHQLCKEAINAEVSQQQYLNEPINAEVT